MWTRRALLSSSLGLAGGMVAAGQSSPDGGKPLKITRFDTHKVTIDRRDFLFLEVHTDQGITGIGEASLPARADIAEQAVRWLEPRLAGQDPAGVEAHWDRMYYGMSRWRDGSVLMTALSAVDIALWDIEGKRLGLPVWRLLGGPVHPRMRVYYSHWSTGLPTGSASAFAERVAESKAQGWDAVKWIVPRAAPESERIARTVRECEGVRNAGGAGFDFGLEMFETFSTRSTIELARAVAPYRPMFIEEPVLREIHGASAEVAAKSPVPLATGEGLLHRYEFKELLDAKGAAIIQPDVIHCGGITEMRKIANLAETYGVELAPHQWYGPIAHVASIQAASVCRNLLIQEWDGANEKLFQDLTAGTFPVQKDGIVSLPQGPGLGLQMDFGEWKRRFPYAPAVR